MRGGGLCPYGESPFHEHKHQGEKLGSKLCANRALRTVVACLIAKKIYNYNKDRNKIFVRVVTGYAGDYN